MSEALPVEDPMPEPPPRPGAGDCCGGGCNPCIFELYEQDRERYEMALAEWKKRNPHE